MMIVFLKQSLLGAIMDRAANAKHSLTLRSVLFLSVTLLRLALAFLTLASIVVNRKAGLASFQHPTNHETNPSIL